MDPFLNVRLGSPPPPTPAPSGGNICNLREKARQSVRVNGIVCTILAEENKEQDKLFLASMDICLAYLIALDNRSGNSNCISL